MSAVVPPWNVGLKLSWAVRNIFEPLTITRTKPRYAAAHSADGLIDHTLVVLAKRGHFRRVCRYQCLRNCKSRARHDLHLVWFTTFRKTCERPADNGRDRI